MAKLLAITLILSSLTAISQAQTTYSEDSNVSRISSNIFVPRSANKAAQNNLGGPAWVTTVRKDPFHWSVWESYRSEFIDDEGVNGRSWVAPFDTIGSGANIIDSSKSYWLDSGQEALVKIVDQLEAFKEIRSMSGRYGITYYTVVVPATQTIEGIRNPIQRGGIPYGDRYSVQRSSMKVVGVTLQVKTRSITPYLSVGSDVSLGEFDATP